MMNVIGDRKRAAEFLEVGEKLKKLQQAIAEGKKIDVLKIDPAVTPVLILGYNEEERQKSKLFCQNKQYRIQRYCEDIRLKIRRVQVKGN